MKVVLGMRIRRNEGTKKEAVKINGFHGKLTNRKAQIIMIKINIAKDYTEIPGGRYKNEFEFSGEDFRETILFPKYEEAIKNGEKLQINFDGGYGYPSSFLEEVFGGLKRKLEKLGMTIDLSVFEFVSDDEPYLIDRILMYMKG